MHYGIQDYSSLDDLLKKVGKVNRMFGKGGMINVSEVRTKMLTDWYQGKLNYLAWLILYLTICGQSVESKWSHNKMALESSMSLDTYLYWVYKMELSGITGFYSTLSAGMSELNRYRSGLLWIWQNT